MGNVSFFEIAFPDVDWNYGGDTQILCPFPHYTSSGDIYYEQNPSAGINLVKGVFNCFQCGQKHSEIGFMAQYMDLDYASAIQIKNLLSQSNETLDDWQLTHKLLLDDEKLMSYLTGELKIPLETIKELQLGLGSNNGIAFPVFLFDHLIDVRTYNPNAKPKSRGRKGVPTGTILPYDLWKENDSSTLICAGEKDMAIARAHGFNAITVTGGELRIPKLFLPQFKNKKVYIVYDNDATGRQGANRLAMNLKPFTDMIKIIDLSDVCKEEGEDLWDFFVKYGKTTQDLVQKTIQSDWFSEEQYEEEKNKEYPMMTLSEASKPQNINRLVRSDIQVIATFETQFYMPSSITATKVSQESEKEALPLGAVRNWYLTPDNVKDILYLIDSNLREDAIYKNKLEKLLNIPAKEPGLKVVEESKETIYKCTLTDTVDSINLDVEKAEYTAYSLNTKLRTGAKYRVTYKLVPHPYEGQKLTMVIVNVEDVNDSVDKFTVNEQRKELLKQFQVDTSLDAKIKELTERVKGIIGEERNDTLIQLIDFWYNTPLQVNINGRIMRSYLDMLIIGESRTGKSSTFNALQKVYELGSRVDFGGSNATKAGIIGGTTQVSGTHKTRAGLLARNHKNAVCFEELGRASVDIIKELTEVRSSGEIKLQRVDGDMHLPAMVRMLSLTNTKESDGAPRSLMSYPHGLSIVTDLIPSAADIARYDVIAIIYEPAAKTIDPFYKPMEPFSNEAYQTRIRWIWSRKPEQVIVSEEIYRYLINITNELNKHYDAHIKLFGIEVWQKIMRLAISIAGYVVSTNEDYTQIIVQKEHIDYAVKLFVDLYINDNFRFAQYVEEQRQFSTIDEDGVAALQKLYNKNSSILFHLEANSSTTARTLQTISGMSGDDFSTFMNQLTTALFITHEGYNIIPTERFRLGMIRIKRKMSVQPLGVTTYGL